MKLRYSTTSPFVRKVHVLAIETGQIDKIELVKTVTTDPDLGRDNPLQKVPAMEMDDGSSLYDSRVICEYLDSRAGGNLVDRQRSGHLQSLTLVAQCHRRQPSNAGRCRSCLSLKSVHGRIDSDRHRQSTHQHKPVERRRNHHHFSGADGSKGTRPQRLGAERLGPRRRNQNFEDRDHLYLYVTADFRAKR